ncbi:MAG: ArgR family transcriptional regulator [Acidobacteriaceae bacterium]|nr:ArgR family transcriptional regulator [Acidobacteriaceae bacterium]MBV9779678.1 ArgR family transcriptional regulator [Acidobacteriaceae bacterium]
MNKSFRQGQILNIVRHREIYTQEELGRELGNLGIQTTQVTLSRDIRELGLVKTADGYRQLQAEPAGPQLVNIASEFLLDMRLAQNLVVLRTSPGNANTLAIALDREGLNQVVGTIAGDDTVLVITPDSETAASFQARMLEMISG